MKEAPATIVYEGKPYQLLKCEDLRETEGTKLLRYTYGRRGKTVVFDMPVETANEARVRLVPMDKYEEFVKWLEKAGNDA